MTQPVTKPRLKMLVKKSLGVFSFGRNRKDGGEAKKNPSSVLSKT